MDFSKYTTLVFDLDDTLITTLSGNIFPQGVWDMQIKWDVFDAVIKLCPNMDSFLIASNQSGIPSGKVNRESFINKILYVKSAFKDYIKYKTGKEVFCDVRFCADSKQKKSDMRKPATGMLTGSFVGLQCANQVLFIGDASGKPGDFADSDKMCAVNFGCDYCDVRDFLEYARN